MITKYNFYSACTTEQSDLIPKIADLATLYKGVWIGQEHEGEDMDMSFCFIDKGLAIAFTNEIQKLGVLKYKLYIERTEHDIKEVKDFDQVISDTIEKKK